MIRHRLLYTILTLALFAPAASASAHDLRPMVTPPATAPAEDSGFAIGLSGDVTGLDNGDGELDAEIRPAGGAPCAPTPQLDPGDSVRISESRVSGPFSVAGSYAAAAPGDYLICAWISDNITEWGLPGSATVTVRPAVFQIAATAPGRVQRLTPFVVTVNYTAEVPRYLTVLVARASNCSISSDGLRAISRSTFEITDDNAVSGVGSLNGTVRVEDTGTYLVCGFFEESSYGTAAAQVVTQLATVVVGQPAPAFRSCGNVGGPRQIRNVRARSVSCSNAKALARRWGRRARAPRTLGSYRCRASSGVVTCTAGSRQVKFRFGRR